MKQILKKIKLSSTLTVVSGLHIGGSKESVEIGGIDSPVIKMATRKGQPYIPGSSLKGKMCCLLEQVNGATEVGKSPKINQLFGFSNDNIPSRLIVRDAYMTEKSEEILRECTSLDMPYTENKFENRIHRITGVAEHPRQIERVPAGTEFHIEMILNIWDGDNEDELSTLLQLGIALIENDYLGGNGSRGYGQVIFSKFSKVELSSANNWKA